jgi:outer membrane protein OmpA-like peptidoglycan-associated protein/tetratricopeptide (TPR) repeat protein
MIKCFNVLFLLLFLIPYSCKSQKVSSQAKNAREHYHKAELLFSDGKYKEAVVEYKKTLSIDSDYSYAIFGLGDSYAALKDIDNAELYYGKYISKYPEKSEGCFALAQCFKDNMKYEEAIPYYELCLAREKQSEDMKTKAARYILDCRFAAVAIKNPVPFEPKSVGEKINTDLPEYFPSISADGQSFIFSRLVRQQEDIYITHKVNGEWVESQPISPLINTDYNEGALCISSNGQYIFFSSNKPDENYGSHDIYFSLLQGNTWSKPYNLGPKINSTSWDSHPSISADGRTLYFLSTRPGGYGAEDIWYSTLDSTNHWNDARNIGPVINTPYREFTPFIYADGNTLYFSSEGHPGMGGLDIFYSTKDGNGNWSEPKNLGYPINTPNIESGFVLSPNGKTAFFAAEEKNQHNNIDIFTFDLYPEAQPKSVAYLKGKVTDSKTGKIVIATAQLIDLETGKNAGTVQNNYATGDYLICLPPNKNYALNVSAKGYLFYSENFEFKLKSGTEPMQKDIQLKPIVGGESVVLNNVFFEVNKADLKPESKIELDKVFALLNDNKTVNLEISGHTDNSGDKISNQKLSENRAKAVVSYLTAKGIDASRLVAKGYGETQPVMPNTTPENKAKNRRTEMKVL